MRVVEHHESTPFNEQTRLQSRHHNNDRQAGLYFGFDNICRCCGMFIVFGILVNVKSDL